MATFLKPREELRKVEFRGTREGGGHGTGQETFAFPFLTAAQRES